MPTLLTINNYHYRRGGADVAYLAQGELFERNGWQVSRFAMQHDDNVDSPWSRYFVHEIEYGRAYGRLRVLQNAAKAIYSWEAASKIRALITDHRPDVAHAHNIYHHLSPSILRALRQEGIPVFLTLHDVKLLCPARTMYRSGRICESCKGGALRHVVAHRCLKGSLPLSALIYAESTLHRLFRIYERNVDKFIAPSRFLIDKFVEWGWPEQRFVHVPNFVDATAHVPEFAAGRALLYFGRLSEEKGLATLVRASQLAGVELWVVGTGPDQEALQALSASLGANVKFFGFKVGNELWSLVKAARAVVLPSEWYENAPISILEAYSLGKPVIGARVGGIPEMVREGRTGFLFPFGDVDRLAGELANIARMADAGVEELGREAREWVIDEYSPARHYERLRALYAKHCRLE